MKVKECPFKMDRKEFKKAHAMNTFLSIAYDPEPLTADIVMTGIVEQKTSETRSGVNAAAEYLRKPDFWRSLRSDSDMNIRVDEDMKAVDTGNLAIDGAEGLSALTAYGRKAASLSAVPFYIGGEEKKVLPAIAQGLTTCEKPAVLRLSAHPAAASSLADVFDTCHSVEIGVRGFTDVPAYDRITEIAAKDAFQESIESLKKTVKDTVGVKPVFVSFDADVLDPAYAPCTVQPTAGGISVQDFFVIIEQLFPLLSVCGVGVFNVAPEFDPGQTGLNDVITCFWKMGMAEAKEIILNKPVY